MQPPIVTLPKDTPAQIRVKIDKNTADLTIIDLAIKKLQGTEVFKPVLNWHGATDGELSDIQYKVPYAWVKGSMAWDDTNKKYTITGSTVATGKHNENMNFVSFRTLPIENSFAVSVEMGVDINPISTDIFKLVDGMFLGFGFSKTSDLGLTELGDFQSFAEDYRSSDSLQVAVGFRDKIATLNTSNTFSSALSTKSLNMSNGYDRYSPEFLDTNSPIDSVHIKKLKFIVDITSCTVIINDDVLIQKFNTTFALNALSSLSSRKYFYLVWTAIAAKAPVFSFSSITVKTVPH